MRFLGYLLIVIIFYFKVTTTLAKCQLDEFDCNTADKLCIPRIDVCDFTEDCENGSDERDNCTQATCGFNGGNNCGWNFNIKDNEPFKWKIGTAIDVIGTASLPNSTVSGHLAYIKGQKGLVKGEDRVMSNVFSRSGSECYVAFTYFCDMYNCPLQVLITYANKTEDLIWNPFEHFNFENTDSKWRSSKAYIGHKENFRVSFKAKQHYNFHFAIAIGEINFLDCSLPKYTDIEPFCDPKMNFKCNNGHCISKEKMCDFTNDCMDNSDELNQECTHRVGNCDFESDCKFWRNDEVTHSFSKMIPSLSSNLVNIPQTDHTTRTKYGSYLSSKTNSRTGNHVLKPRLVSKIISPDSKSCQLRFWVNVIGESLQNTITVYKRDGTGNEHLIAQQSVLDVYDFWHRIDVDLIIDKNPFELVIAAIVRRIGSVSIDDISFSSECKFLPDKSFTTLLIPQEPTTVPPLLTTSSIHRCPPNAYLCKTVDRCYYFNERCDFKDDCGDNTDEEACGFDCDFETPCPWFSRPGSMAKWVLHNGSSIHWKEFTGPKFDHTFGNNSGHYLVTDGNKYHWGAAVDTIELESPFYYDFSKRCKFEFYYHMFGHDMGTLNVHLRNSNTRKSLLWSVTGNQGDKWFLASVFVGQQRERFDLVIEAVFGDGKGPKDFAIDDLKFVDCGQPSNSCKSDEEMCKDNSMCFKEWQKCDGIFDCKDKSDEQNCQPTKGSCNFNDPNWLKICQWSHLQEDFEWQTASRSSTNTTGPQSLLTDEDRLTKNSETIFSLPKFENFLYFNSSGKETGDIAAVSTPVFPASVGVCHLTYFYYMFGSPKMGTFKVKLLSKESDRVLKTIFEMTGNHGPKWIFANHLISSVNSFKVAFEGIVGESGLSDIAIDRVRFNPNCMDATIPIAPTNCTGFKCGDGFCVPPDLVCNCERDCIDGSDEIGCNIDCNSGNVSICNKKGHFHCFNSKRVCIPGIMVCDGIEDCPNGEDEYDCPFICDQRGDFYFCPQGNESTCRPITEACDGKDHCASGYDESLCDVDECPKNYCGGNATCIPSAGLPFCKDCANGTFGMRCIAVTIISTTTSSAATVTVVDTSTITSTNTSELKQSKTYPYSVISMGIMSLIILIAVIVIVVVRKTDMCERQPMRFDNPVYEMDSPANGNSLLVI